MTSQTRCSRPARTGMTIDRDRAAAALARFRRDETGTLTVFSIYIAVLILMLGGIAVDVMRSEQVRTAVQNVEDTAVLAATNLNQTLSAESVVQDYFDKAGMGQYLQSVQVTSSQNYKQVQAVATTSVPTLFMKLLGINSLNTVNNSTAVESIGNVEVALALDNSGSMNQQASAGTTTQCTTTTKKGVKYQSCYTVPVYTTKIAALQTAASEFVDTMFSQVEPGALTMSIFPYDSHVDIGPDLLQYLNVSNEQTKAKCVDFLTGDFATTAISPTAQLQRTAYANLENSTTSITNSNVECNSASYRDSIVFSNDATALKTTINNMQAGGYTSIDSGVKWAAASLDPAWQPVVNDMIAAGKLPSSYTGRPAAYNDRTHMKVLIVMSDGENTSRYQLKPGYYAGSSPYFANYSSTGTLTSNWSFYDASKGSAPYFWSVDKTWHAQPFGTGGGSYTYCTAYYYGTCSSYGTATASGTATQWTYPQLWAAMSTPYYLNNVLTAVYGSQTANAMYNNIVDVESASEMDSYLHTICSAAKANGDIVYSIGFQTTTHGAATLSDCASAPSYYFNAQGTEISSVFSKIANSIVHLRLTQ